MPIVVPGRRLGIAYAGGANAAKKKLKRHKRAVDSPLMLTPMVDMFVILVLYLIQQFSASGQILFIDPTMKLPEARRAVDMAGNPPIITISKTMISVQGKPAEATDQLIKDGYWAAPKLEEKLKEMRDLSTRVSNATGGQITTESAQGVIVMQADVGVPYMLVKKVLFTANKTGFVQVNFAVTRGGLSAEEVAAATEGGGETPH
jgi:biopolymer transport protein ExbD